jgi:dipeptidase E
MRLFLSSSDLSFPRRGDALAAELAGLVGAVVRTAVVLNALDDAPDLPRQIRMEDERRGLATLGADAFELDLRDYYEQPAGLRGALVTYGGYSAGACVAGPALRGADLFDDGGGGKEPLWGGLGLVDFSIVPHYRSGGSEAEAFERIAAHLQLRGLAHRVLRDGQAIVVSGGSISLHE